MPNPILPTIDLRKTALVLIDVQKGILSLPLTPHSAATVAANSALLARRIAAAGGTIVLVRVTFSDGFVDAPPREVDVPLAVPSGGLPADWAEFAPDLAEIRPDVVITKRQWSAFHGTELDLQLRRRGIDTIVLGGVATNFGVESTARDGWQHNYAVIVAADASSSLGDGLHQFALEKTLPRVSKVRTVEQILAALPAA
jgi:nicotinamidase-related amidase